MPGDDAAASLVMPVTIGSYDIERELGRGGMGAVYVGVHRVIGRRAAIKVLLPQVSQRADLVQRFVTEAKAATAIRHPGIVEVFDYGTGPDGSAYLVMEYLEGESLAARMKSHGRLAIPQAVAIARQIALALGAAHRAGIVHRDLKPDNVFLVPDPVDGRERIKLLDFGVAKLVDSPESIGRHSSAIPGAPAQTVTGAILGTPQYMSPEQCEGSRVVDHRTDQYSLGCTLFQMLCGRLPFVETGIGGLIGAHLHTPAPELREHCQAASPALAAIVARLLAKAPDGRFGSADELARALEDPAVSAMTRPQPIPVTPVAGYPTPPDLAMKTHLPAPTRSPAKPASRRGLILGLGLVGAAIAGTIAFVAFRERTVTVTSRESVASGSAVAEPPQAPPPKVDVIETKRDPSPAELRLLLVRDAADQQNWALVADELALIYGSKPDAKVTAQADTLKAEVAPRAIASAVIAIDKLRDAGKCDQAKAEAKRITALWGKSLSLDQAATPCTSSTPKDLQDPYPTDPAAAIVQAYNLRQFGRVVALCTKHPPDRASLYVPCMASACRLKRPRVAISFMQARKPTAADTRYIVDGLNECQVAGVTLTDEMAKLRREKGPRGERP
jgi:serine/threonine protein kinase